MGSQSWFMMVLVMMMVVQLGSCNQLSGRCEEIYVVGEGETLHSISDKCQDPFIVEHNPQIVQDSDVYPGLVIRITPPPISRKLLF
ncbi:hypothetical protein DCAR_0414701 [Daucus carota subsp. sativus]|uniref:LysM domain-containing protein n=1 Tax=Daucus carota subsp. sativus TaxID=79200 RepID=A0AAF1AWZ8_DAUCS|nr:hypothetical protein DCAR_0414701 [Daucus carota subsp. sativus]